MKLLGNTNVPRAGIHTSHAGAKKGDGTPQPVAALAAAQ